MHNIFSFHISIWKIWRVLSRWSFWIEQQWSHSLLLTRTRVQEARTFSAMIHTYTINQNVIMSLCRVCSLFHFITEFTWIYMDFKIYLEYLNLRRDLRYSLPFHGTTWTYLDFCGLSEFVKIEVKITRISQKTYENLENFGKPKKTNGKIGKFLMIFDIIYLELYCCATHH